MSTSAYLTPPPSIDWLMIAPVLVVVITGLVGLILEMFRPKGTNTAIVLTSLVGLVGAGVALAVQFGMPSGDTFGGMVRRDPAALAFQFLLIASAFLTILFSEPYLRQKRAPFGEFYPLLVWSTAGGMIMVATNSLLMLFIGLEVLSIALYVMAGIVRQESKSEESAIKYLLLGAFGSGFLLYGIAFIYGATGGLDLSGIARAWTGTAGMTQTLLFFGLGLMLVGLGFKAALVPFHQWTPDVYQGAPTNVTAFMASASKIAAIGALYRVLDACAVFQNQWMPLLFWVSILTMTVGNLVALRQTDVKRTLAYSSIANAGYVLVAILAHIQRPDVIGVGTTMVFLASYVLMTIGAFAVVSLTAHHGREGTRFADLHGLWKASPFSAGALVVFLASLIGVPPTAGFFAKLFIFQDALTADLMPLAIVLAVNSAISAYYYLGMAVACFVGESTEEAPRQFAPVTGGFKAAVVLCLVGVIGLTFVLTPAQSLMPAGTSAPVATRVP